MTTSTRRGGLATAAAFLLLTLLAACGGGDSPSSGGADAPATSFRAADGDAGGSAARAESAEQPAGVADAALSDKTSKQPALQAAVISNGNVAMKSADVGQAIFDVRKVVDRHRGEVAEDTTETDDDGDALRSRMVLRVPSGEFADAMEALEDVATLITSSSSSKDVTTAVLDKRVRIQVQKRSIARIAVLLDRATSIRDIVNIEAELSRRQAELASLERQSRYLADQTSMSTITVSVERTREKTEPKEKETEETGFLAGLSAGWEALATFGVGLATVLGALLPWVVVLAILAIPGWPLLRRLRRTGALASTSAQP